MLIYYVIYNDYAISTCMFFILQWCRCLSCWLGDTVMWWTILRSLTVGIRTSMRAGISAMQSTSGRGTSSSSDSLITLSTQQINIGVFISFIVNFLPSEDHNCKQ